MAERVEVIAELRDLVSGRFADINRQIDVMDGRLSRLGGGSIGGGGIMSQVLGANLLGGAISRAGSAMVDFAKDTFQAYGRQEQFQTSLKTLLYGNEEQAKALNNQLKAFAIESPFELTEIQQATRLMIAYGSTAGGVVDEMRMLGDVSSGASQPLGEVAYLYGTIRQQQKANLIDLRQFANRGIPIFKELAKVTKYTLQQLVEGGKDVDVTFRDVEKAFKNMTASGGQFHNMMAEQAKTLLGQTSNLADAWDQLKAAIGESQSGILKGTISWATMMVNAIKEAINTDNYRENATIKTKDEFKIRETAWYNPGTWDWFGLNNKDKDADERFYSRNSKTGNVKEFKNREDQDQFYDYAKDGKNYSDVGTAGTEARFINFSSKWFDKVQKLGASKNQPKDILSMMKEVLGERADIIQQLEKHTISSSLAVNQLDILTQVSKDISGLKSLAKSKEVVGKEPAKLEEVAKKNKAVQVIVNIENLVKELTNINQQASALNQLTTNGTLKALIVAVNDIYSAGQV